MKKFALTMLLTLGTLAVTQAQYNKPNSITYDPINRYYYVSNTGDGTITRIDASFKTSTVIQNLVEPKGLFFIQAGGSTLLVVLDVDNIRVYDPVGYSLISTVSVTGATNLEDAVVDLNNINVFYLSDRGGNKIIRGELGPPPFYVPSFSDLSTGIDRPTGLWFDDQGRLLMVQDTTDSPISEVDTANGNVTVLKSTNLDNLNAIIQDKQGNYFITSWGDDNLYRFTPDLQDSVSLLTFDNPTGFYLNASQDLLLLACSNCNKIEFLKLHNFIPIGGVTGCPGDSATVYINPAYQSIGTYDSSNQFIVERSDDNGDFSPPIIVGRVYSSTVPGQIAIKIPDTNYGTGNLVYRIRSTAPFILSPEYPLTVSALPVAKASDYDKLGACVNTPVQLGGTTIKDYLYAWTLGDNLNDSTIASPVFSAADTGEYTLFLTVTDSRSGCSASDSVVISVNPDLSLPQLPEIVSFCDGDSAAIGVTNAPYRFQWTPNFAIDNDTISNPVTWTPNDVKYFVSFTDPVSGCSGNDSVVVLVNPSPGKPSISRSFSTCSGEALEMTVLAEGNVVYTWDPDTNLNTDTGPNVTFSSTEPGTYTYTVIATNPPGCTAETEVVVNNWITPSPVITAIVVNEGISDDTIYLDWYDTTGVQTGDVYLVDTSGTAVLQTTIPEGIISFVVSDLARYLVNDGGQEAFDLYIKVTSSNGCSDSVTFRHIILSVQEHERVQFRVAPNPSNGMISISGLATPISKLVVVNSMGQKVKQFDAGSDWSSLDVSDLPADLYQIIVWDDYGNRGIEKLLLY